MAIRLTVELTRQAEKLFVKLTEGENGLEESQVFEYAFYMLNEAITKPVYTKDKDGNDDRYVLREEYKAKQSP